MRSTDASTATSKERSASSRCTRPAAAVWSVQDWPSVRAKRVVQIGIDSGFLTSADHPHIEIHPLLQEFLIRKLSEERPSRFARIVARSARLLIRNHEWDEAQRLISRIGDERLMSELVVACSDDLLSSGRVASLRGWITAAEHDSPDVRMVEAELAFREGRFHESESLAVLAAEDQRTAPGTRSRAYLTAGRAAHAASRAWRAAELYGHALDQATHTRIDACRETGRTIRRDRAGTSRRACNS